MVSEFIELLGLQRSVKSEFDFDQELPFFIQESADETLGYESDKPYFVVPISSATHKNIEPLKYALFNLVQQSRK
jgi:GTP-binding protein